MISLPFRLSSRDTAKSMLVKGLLIESNKTCLTGLFVIIHKVTHGDIKLVLHMRGQMQSVPHCQSAPSFFFCYIDTTFLYYQNTKSLIIFFC